MSGGQNECYCWTCDRVIKSLGIARHRSSHRDKFQNCKITYSNGETYIHNYSYAMENA
jgi:competence transcription factor ComK